MDHKSALIIFVRNPVLGKVKTRIAATVGSEEALKIYKRLLEQTHSITQNLMIDKYIFYADFINHDDIWENDIYKKALQSSMELGERMKNAFGFLFENGYNAVGIIGSDCYDLTEQTLSGAFEKLTKTQVVIGPAKDGGYYFIGMSSFEPQLFDNKNWSSSTVLQQTVEQLNDLDIEYYQLITLSDVDEAEDVNFSY